MLIYEPSGKAREYSPLALNIYSGCDHDCFYCYCKKMQFLKFSPTVTTRTNILTTLQKELAKNVVTKQVLLSFTGDPYCKSNDTLKITRSVLARLWLNNVPVAILSKGGSRILQDIDLFKKFKLIKIGATLTFDNQKDSLANEPGAAIPQERIETLKILSEGGLKTWVSIEPVIDPVQSLSLIEKSLPFVDHYKIGKLNHFKNSTNWSLFLKTAVEILRKNDKAFYIKNDLAKYSKGLVLTQEERDHDFLALSVPN
jgi:DNA repair photolyase